VRGLVDQLAAVQVLEHRPVGLTDLACLRFCEPADLELLCVLLEQRERVRDALEVEQDLERVVAQFSGFERADVAPPSAPPDQRPQQRAEHAIRSAPKLTRTSTRLSRTRPSTF
jgi:hypothetical protein